MKTEQIDSNLPYERRYYPGLVFQREEKIYEVIEYRIPSGDDLYVSPSNLFANTIIDNSQYRGSNYDPAWIVEELQDLTGYNLHYKNKFSPGQKVTLSNGDICTVVRYGDPRVGNQAFLAWRVEDIDPILLGDIVEIDTCIDNGNRWIVTDIQKRRTYENSYTIGQVITDENNIRWTVVAYRVAGAKDFCVKNSTLFMPTIVNGFAGVERWIVEPYYEVKEAPSIWDEDMRAYKHYTKPAKLRVYDRAPEMGELGYLSGFVFIKTNPVWFGSNYCEFEYDPRTDEELYYKESLRRQSTEKLIESGVGATFTSTAKRNWFREVLLERLK